MSTDNMVLKGDSEISRSVLEKMLGRSIAKLTDSKTGAEGWKKLFTPRDIVGVKVNCLFGKGVSTRPEFVQSVIEGLKMAGVNEDNIIIWDRSTSDLLKVGYIPNKDGKGVKCYADDSNWGELIERGAFKGHISKVISEKVTAIVNVPILKTHGITGISCCLKNHYGSFDNPGSHHGNHCNPALADFNSIPMVKEKTRLMVVDALRPQYEGGPGLQARDQWNYYSILMSKDPLAADYQGMQILAEKRAKAGLQPFTKEQLAWMQSAQERGVGMCDPAKIELLKV